MSQPKRYAIDSDGVPYPLDTGDYVRHSDYASLAAENERLKASQLSLEKWIACEQAHFETADNLREKLYQASVQIERLRKAGDQMDAYLKRQDGTTNGMLDCRRAWLEAKEGGAK